MKINKKTIQEKLKEQKNNNEYKLNREQKRNIIYGRRKK